MALAIVGQAEAGAKPIAPTFVDRVEVTFDASYPTGGELFDPLPVIGKGKTIVAVLPVVVGGRIVQWDRANGKLQVFEDAGSAGPLREVPDATDLLALVAEVTILSQ